MKRFATLLAAVLVAAFSAIAETLEAVFISSPAAAPTVGDVDGLQQQQGGDHAGSGGAPWGRLWADVDVQPCGCFVL